MLFLEISWEKTRKEKLNNSKLENITMNTLEFSGPDSWSIEVRLLLRGIFFHRAKLNWCSCLWGNLLLPLIAVMMSDNPCSTAQINHRQQDEVKEVHKKLEEKQLTYQAYQIRHLYISSLNSIFVYTTSRFLVSRGPWATDKCSM